MPPDPDLLRVATWNIRAAIGPGEPFPPAWWRHVDPARLHRIAAIVEALDADVVALQEVTVMTVGGELSDQPYELARLTGRHVRYSAAHAFPLVRPEDGVTIGVATWGNALLTRVPLSHGVGQGLSLGLDHDHVDPIGSGRPLAGIPYALAPYGVREPRCIVGGRLRHGSGSVGIVGTHLTYAGAEQRRTQAGELEQIASDLGDPVIIMGDLNAPIDATELTALAMGFDDAFQAVGVPIDSPLRVTSGDQRIDHILSRGFRSVACRVATEAGDASDHRPVVAILERATGA